MTIFKFLSQRRRRRDNNLPNKTNNIGQSTPRWLLSSKVSSSTASSTHDESTGCSTDREDILPVWKPENFLTKKPLSEDDWWLSADDRFDYTENYESDEDGADSTNSESSFSSTKENVKSSQRRFCNRGEQAWTQCRKAWNDDGRLHYDASNKAKAIPTSFQKELVKCLKEKRQFELSQPISLSDMVQSYVVCWEETGDP